jgi:hypothetical protein
MKTAWSPPSQPTGSSTAPSSTSPTSASGSPVPTPKPRHTGAIIGGAVGGIACIALVGLAYLLVRRRRRPTTAEDDHDRGQVVKPFLGHELESPDLQSPPDFGSPVAELPVRERPVVEVEGAVPELQAEEAPKHHIRRKPVPELP